jgi:hypothetical protein
VKINLQRHLHRGSPPRAQNRNLTECFVEGDTDFYVATRECGIYGWLGFALL